MKKIILFIGILILLSSFGSAITTDGLIVYSSFDIDYSNEFNSGTYDFINQSGAFLTSGTAKNGKSVDCDGVNAFINTTNPFNNTAYTFGFWMNRRTDKNDFEELMQAGGFGHFQIFNDDKLFTTKASGNMFSTTLVGTDNWLLVGISHDGTTKRMWVNGTNEVSSVMSLPSNTDFWNICQANGAVSYDGFIDEVFVFNRALNTTEWGDIYNNGVGNFTWWDSLSLTLNINLLTPENNTISNVLTQNFTFNLSSVFEILNCSLYTNETGNWIIEETIFGSFGSFCYQEFFNVSTTCGGLSSGTIKNTGDLINNLSAVIDGNFETASSVGNLLLSQLLINYTKPSNAFNGSLWRVKRGVSTTTDIIVPNICFNQNVLQFRIDIDKLCGDSECAFTALNCYNGTGFEEISGTRLTGGGEGNLFEEAMRWNISIFNTSNEIEHNFSSEGNYIWNINCNNNSFWGDSNFTLIIDTTAPMLEGTTFANLSIFFNNNLTGQFNFSDNNLVHFVNISIDGILSIFLNESINLPTFSVDISQNITGLSRGNHNLIVTVSDAHTAKELKDPSGWNVKNGIFNNYLEYNIRGKYTPLDLKISIEDGSIFDDWTYKVKKDSYSEIVKPNKPKSEQIFLIESTQPMEVVTQDNNYGGEWLIIDEHWKDFVLKEEPNAIIEYIELINPYTARVKITNITNNINRLEFNSIGDLNILTIIYNFTVANVTETFQNPIFEDFASNLTLDFNGGFTGVPSSVILQWNDINTTPSLIISNSTLIRYTDIRTANLNVSNSTNIEHQWFIIFNSSILNETDFTLPQNQTLLNINVSQCEGANIYPILNITYFNEIIQTTELFPQNDFDLTIFDGTFFYNQTGVFTSSPSSSNHTFCTNLNPDQVDYSWTMWNTMEINLISFATRFFNIPAGSPLTLSNNPKTDLSILLIPESNATAVEYTWTTTDFQPIDGTMKVFRCNPDGSESLTDSPVIVSGRAVSNIELLTALYKYTVTIGDTTFSQPSFSTCHPESSTIVTFRVNTGITNVVPAIGLLLTSCSLTKVNNNTVNLEWGINTKSDATIEGCVIARKNTNNGLTTILQNCSNTSNFDTSFSESNSYFVNAELRQSGITIQCEDVISFFTKTGTQDLLGNAGVFASILLIMGLFLLFVGEGKGFMGAAGVGIIGAWILGILAFNWIIVSSLIAFLIIITLIGKQASK